MSEPEAGQHKNARRGGNVLDGEGSESRSCSAAALLRLATIPIQMTTSERFDGLNDKCRHRYLLKIIIHLPIDLNDLIQQENFCLTTVVS